MQARLLYQLTSPMHRTLGEAEICRRREFLAAHAADGTQVDVAPIEDGPPAIEGAIDAAMVVPQLLRETVRWSDAGYNATIIGCFSDPGMDALRDTTPVPVIGPGAAAIHLAAQFGTRFSILSPSGRAPGRVAARMRALGVAALFASVRGVNCSVMELARQAPGALARVTEAGRRCVEQDGADVIVLGCMSMAFLPGVTDLLRDEIGCLVINPVLAALKTAEAAVTLGLGRVPPAKVRESVRGG